MHGMRNDAGSILEQREESVRLHPRLDEQAVLNARRPANVGPAKAGPYECVGCEYVGAAFYVETAFTRPITWRGRQILERSSQSCRATQRRRHTASSCRAR